MENIRDDRVELFISKFCQWADKRQALSPKDSKKLSPALRKFIYEAIPEKANDYHLGVGELVDSDDLKLEIISESHITVPSGSGKLLIGAFTPDWSQGLRKYLKNEYVYDLVSWFFHFAEQYVRRSILVEVMGAISLVYDRPTSFYSSSYQRLSVKSFDYEQNQYIASAFGNHQMNSISMDSPKQKQVSKLTILINGLDPFIHRLIFNFIRAQELRDKFFAEEAITTLDKTLNVAEQFIRERLQLQDQNQREALGMYLNFNKIEMEALEHIYQLRCFFGGHPAVSKWWDFSEMYPEETEEMYFDLVRKVIIKIVESENQHRIIEKHPEIWGEWFRQNWKVVWDSCWFEKTP